jgi:hypothetical protein
MKELKVWNELLDELLVYSNNGVLYGNVIYD